MELRLKELMEEKSKRDGVNITQSMVSEATGIPQGTISKWVGNKVDRMDKHIIQALINYFDCGVEDLIAAVPEDV